MFLISSCSCICQIHWSQVLSQEWRCNWSDTGAAPTTCEWSSILLFTTMRRILEVWRYIFGCSVNPSSLYTSSIQHWHYDPCNAWDHVLGVLSKSRTYHSTHFCFQFDNMLFVWRRYFDPSFDETNVKLPGLPVFFLMYTIWTSAKWQFGQKSLDMSLWNGHVNVIDHVCVTVRYQWQVRRIIESFWYNTLI